MRKFLQDIIICFMFFMTIWVVAEISKEKIYIPNGYSYKYKQVKGNPSIKTLLIGHSHFERCINPYLMGDSVYVFAINGRRWIYWDLRLAEQIIPTMSNLQTVIFPLGYDMPYESPHYRNLTDIDKECIYQYTKNMHVKYDRFPQNYLYGSALISNNMKITWWHEKNQDPLGYYKLEGHSSRWEIDQNVRPDVYMGDIAKLCYQEYQQYLIALAKVCTDYNIRFIVVTCPCADCYVKNTRKEGVDNLYALIDSVRIHYPVEYINYMDDAEFRADSLFYNSSHLNAIGADKFAIRVKNDFQL